MIHYNDDKNLLVESNWTPSLQDVKEPHLFREIYDYENVPKVSFNFRQTPIDMPDKIWITDTTFRDGQQSMQPLTADQIVHIYKLLHKLGGKKGIIRQSEFFLYTEKDREAARRCMELGYEFPEVTSWIRANEKDFQLVKDMGIKETGILVSCSDYHIFKKMNMTRSQAAEKYLSVVKMALERGIVPRCHFEDITRADFYGFVAPFAYQLMELSQEAGIPIKIRACDTMGYAVNYPGATLPRSVAGTIFGLRYYSQVPSEQLEWHGHNDFYKVVPNAASAWLYGCSAVNCTALGIGERTGNCPIEAMVMEYCSLRGKTDGMNLSVITDIAEYYEKEIGYEIPPRTPFVGRDFNTTRAGVHADGLLKDQEIYNIFDTEKILRRPPLVAVDVNSGLAGIAYWINAYFKVPKKYAVDKKADVIVQIKDTIDKEFAAGRTTYISDGELVSMLASFAPDLFAKLQKKDYKHLNG